MNSITQVAFEELSVQGRRTRRFRKFSQTRAAPEVVSRQAQITLSAFQAYGSRDDALSFLNGHSDDLGGRPLDVAGFDEAGLVAASAALVTLTKSSSGKGL